MVITLPFSSAQPTPGEAPPGTDTKMQIGVNTAAVFSDPLAMRRGRKEHDP